ncbi:hypothetical protein [Saccharothrix sp. ST-888]|uniref:hypothetical protein n=1 Tax=Saccharothrix sp. ST-888 TaxID=1427391 RepID=UPI0005EC564D|nr:hypothetical protein [Saccharothrix sp. ST-888]KJK55528.1 hypothetical protein UK12_28090 [Saccharothrix sp. ST-888]
MTTFTPLAMAGNSTSNGAFNPTRLQLLLLSVSGNSTSSGAVTLTTSSVAGAFDDFGVTPWIPGSEYTDPALSHVVNSTVRAGGSDPVNQWVRLSITASAPARYPAQGGKLYSRAAYAGVRVSSDAMPAGSTQQVAYAQIEKTPGTGGVDINRDRPGINLLDIEQASYEGRCLYTPDLTAIPTGASYTRSSESASCGLYSGKYTYNTPPANTYQTVQGWKTYQTARAQRATYANLQFDAPPGVAVGLGPGQSTFTLLPRAGAYARVTAGTFVVAEVSISIAAFSASQTGAVRLLEYDASYNLLKSTDGPYATLTGGNTWQRFQLQTTIGASTVWAVVVPAVKTSAPVNAITFRVDEHRLFSPSTVSQAAVGTSPARPWQPPRQLLIRLSPTRINYCTNPSFTNNTNGLSAVVPVGAATPQISVYTGSNSLDGASALFSLAPSLLSVYTSAGTPGWQGLASGESGVPFVSGLKPTTTYTLSAYTAVTAGTVPITLWVYDGRAWIRGTTSAPRAAGTAPVWTRLAVTFTTSGDFPGPALVRIGQSTRDIVYYYGPIAPGSDQAVWQQTKSPANQGAWSPTTIYSNITPDVVTYNGANWAAILPSGPRTNASTPQHNFLVDRVLVEPGSTPGAYFDGNMPSLDFTWEGTPGNSRSLYYRGRSVNQYRLDQSIQRALPLGAQYQIIYAPPS